MPAERAEAEHMVAHPSQPGGALLVDSPAFAEMVAEFFDDGVKPENSYRVTLERGRLRWTTSDGGTVRVYTKEPETSWGMRFKADALGLLPIHSML
jgi:cardiolipin synthase C